MSNLSPFRPPQPLEGQGTHAPITSTANLAESSSDAHPASHSSNAGDHDSSGPGKAKKAAKRRKVNHACLYCRRSHMTCDEGRPCQRCIKREIGHLCHDERRSKTGDKQPASNAASTTQPSPTVGEPVPTYPPNSSFTSNSQATSVPVTSAAPTTTNPSNTPSWSMGAQPSFLYRPDTLGNEFAVLTDFLETLDDSSFFTPPSTVAPSLMSSSVFQPNGSEQDTVLPSFAPSEDLPQSTEDSYVALSQPPAPSAPLSSNNDRPPPQRSPETANIVLPSATKTEKFLLTAADQASGSRDERLNRVIRSKYEAGLLKPYNYVKGYARLSRWMDQNVSQQSKQQILQPLSVLRPKFRAVAQSLRDIDLVFIEEAFERLLLDYDRVFSAMGVPACLWRRTGEIYKANREFTELVGLEGFMMRDGRICIYELMAEESAVNYWEKYGHVAFDSTQKAVLTSCVLRYKPKLNPTASPQITRPDQDASSEERLVSCCFSFTIRRDKWGIPSMIVGNFIRC